MRASLSLGLLLLWANGYTFAAPRISTIPTIFEQYGDGQAFAARSAQYRVVVGPGSAARFQFGADPVTLELEGSRQTETLEEEAERKHILAAWRRCEPEVLEQALR